MTTQEHIFETTRDSWGFTGVCHYRRGRYSVDMTARADCSDSSSGHGWAGVVNANRWQEMRSKSAAWAFPYRFSDGETFPEMCDSRHAEGWLVYSRDGFTPQLFATEAEAIALGKLIAENEMHRSEGIKNDRWPARGSIAI